MKFITEDDLRYLYKHQSFTAYSVESGTKLTPGGRQFLADRGIPIAGEAAGRPGKTGSPGIWPPAPEKKNPLQDKKFVKLKLQLKSVRALFLLTAQELLSDDVILSQELIRLAKQLGEIQTSLWELKKTKPLNCKSCTGIREDDFFNDLDDCFEITEFHIQAQNGKAVIQLHQLRCRLREVQLFVLEQESVTEESELKTLYLDAAGNISQVINLLSQLICKAFGGKTCQKNI